MVLYKRKTTPKPGLPESVVVILLAVVAFLAASWWRTTGKPGWPPAPGWAVSCTIKQTHFNAEFSKSKVTVAYEYSVGGVVFAGNWEGYWPTVHSPNALTEDQLEVLRTPKYPLVVHYNPQHPSRSRLHNPDADEMVMFALLTFGAGVGLLFYCARLYPAWKRRRAHQLG